VTKLIVRPKIGMKMNVPIRMTGRPDIVMMVLRKLPKKNQTTRKAAIEANISSSNEESTDDRTASEVSSGIE
jgi:hypothetical protein